MANAHLGIVQALPCVVWKLTMVALVPFTAISHITFQQVTAEAQQEHSRLNPLDPVSTALAPVFSRLENGTGSHVGRFMAGKEDRVLVISKPEWLIS